MNIAWDTSDNNIPIDVDDGAKRIAAWKAANSRNRGSIKNFNTKMSAQLPRDRIMQKLLRAKNRTSTTTTTTTKQEQQQQQQQRRASFPRGTLLHNHNVQAPAVTDTSCRPRANHNKTPNMQATMARLEELASQHYAAADGDKNHCLTERDILEIVDIVKSCPPLATKGMIDFTGYTPLQMILHCGADLIHVQAIVEAAMAHYHRGTPRNRDLLTAAATTTTTCGDNTQKDHHQQQQHHPLSIAGKMVKQELPLHIACCSAKQQQQPQQQDEIIEYLATLYPQALRLTNGDGKLPIELLLEQRRAKNSSSSSNDNDNKAAGCGPSLHTIRLLLLLCPESIVHIQRRVHKNDLDEELVVTDNNDDEGEEEEPQQNALNCVLMNRYPEHELLKTMIDLFPASADHYYRGPCVLQIQVFRMNTDTAREVAKLFGKLQQLKLQVTAWTDSAFCHVMERLEVAPASFQKLFITLPAYSLSKRHGDTTRKALQVALERNTSLSELHLDVCKDDRRRWDRREGSISSSNNNALFLRSLVRGLGARASPLETLQLINFILPTAHQGLGELCKSSRGGGPRVLILSDLQILKPSTDIAAASHDDDITCVGKTGSMLEELRIQSSKVTLQSEVRTSCDSFTSMVKGIITTNCFRGGRLRKLVLDWRTSRKDLGSSGPILDVNHVLREAPMLQSLLVHGCRLSNRRGELAQGLKCNNSLKDISSAVPAGETKTTWGRLVVEVDAELVHVLEHHNTTLTDINPIFLEGSADLRERFQYFLDLNQFGRGKITDHRCDLATLVKLLTAIPSDKTTRLHYGLLLERPELWTKIA